MHFIRLFVNYRFLFLIILSFTINEKNIAQNKHKKILLINSYHVGYPWTDSITSSIISVLNKTDKVDLFVEYLDGKRYEDSSYFEKLYQIYQLKYKKGMFDLVILTDNLALEFSLTYGDFLYGKIPVVFCGVSNPSLYNLSEIPYCGITETDEDEPIFRQMIKMFPEMKNIYFISDKTQTGVEALTRIKQVTNKLPSTIKYHFIDDIDLDSLFLDVKKIKKTDAIFLITLHRDRYGMPINYGRVTTEICSVSEAPVFCNYFSNIGKGVIGGCFVDAVEQGYLSAELALDILFTPNFKPQKVIVPKAKYTYDYNILHRFGIPLETLPKDSRIINLPENIYQKYIKQIWLTIGLILFLITIIGLLLINILKRKKAEQIVIKQFSEIQKQHDEIVETNQKLNRTIGELENTNKTLAQVNSELVITKEHAEESDRLKSAFLANMSHEIRTPMNGILGFAGLLQQPHLTDEKQQQYIQIIEKSGERMLNIINNLIDIAKVEAGQMEVSVSKTNINNQIEYIYTFFKPEVEKKGLHFSFQNSLSFSNAYIFTDIEKIYAILTNLVKNAIKYCDIGSIEFGYEKKENFLEFFVKDTGIGIASDRQQAVFERFVQADILDKRALQGAGLGLAITKAYIEMLGGNIWVESELGMGSKFYFTIPYKTDLKDEIVLQNENYSLTEEKQFNKLKILIAEDDEISDLLITLVLEKVCYEFIHARTGLEAVEACRNNPDIDLVLMDIQMPQMNGHEATRLIRQFNKNIIIFAQTAYVLKGDKEQAIAAGCNDFVSKPINKDELMDLIERYFKE